MLEMSTESVGSSASCLQPRRLSFQEEDPARNLQTTPDQMYNPNPFFPPQQEGHVRNNVSDSVGRGSVSAASDRPMIPTPIPQNAPGVANSLSFSPWQNGNFTVNRHPCQPTHSPISQNTPEAVKAPCTPEAYNGNKGLQSGVGGSGPSDRQALVKLMMDGEELPELLCPCGKGPCMVRISRTNKNPNRRFYKCSECNFFKWCDELGQNSRSPSKSSQGYIKSPGKIIKSQNAPLEPVQPTCFCKAGPCIVLTMHEGENKGRKYYACPIKKGQGACIHFEWVDNPVKTSETENNSKTNQNNILIADVTTPEPKQSLSKFKGVDNPVKPPGTDNNGNQNNLFNSNMISPEPTQTLSPYESVKDLFGEHDMGKVEFSYQGQTGQNDPDSAAVTTPEPKQSLSTFKGVDNPVKPHETDNNGNQNNLFNSNMTSPEPKQTLSPYESVKDLFGEHDMGTVEFWRQGQNDQNNPDSAAASAYETSKKLSPSKRPRQPSTEGQPSVLGEISPMKRLNLNDASPVVENCRMCGELGQCTDCPILTCFREDDFAENKHENVVDGVSISNLANIYPIGGTAVQNVNPSSLKRSGKCFNCGKEGHWSSECTVPRGANSACFKCGQIGHWMKNCTM